VIRGILRPDRAGGEAEGAPDEETEK
jgi:hypothetical protein